MPEETTAFGKATKAAQASPFKTAGAAVILATAAQQGIPPAIEYFQAKDIAETAAHESHIETLGVELEKCQVGRQTCMDRLMECHNVPVSAELPGEWGGEDWP